MLVILTHWRVFHHFALPSITVARPSSQKQLRALSLRTNFTIFHARRVFVFYGFTIRFSKQNKTALVGLWYHILFLFWLYLMHRNIRSIPCLRCNPPPSVQGEINKRDLAFCVRQARGLAISQYRSRGPLTHSLHY